MYWIIFIGFALLIFSGIIILFSKRDILFNIICYIINSIALGFCLRSWYMFREFDNDLWITLLVSLSCVVYLLIFYFLLYIPFFNKHFMFYIWTFFILTLIAYIIVVATSKTTFVSTFGYFVIVEISFIFSPVAFFLSNILRISVLFFSSSLLYNSFLSIFIALSLFNNWLLSV